MRTRQEIYDEIEAKADQYDALSELKTNPSKVAFWKAIKDVVSFTVFTLETLFKTHSNEVQTLIKQTEPGTDDWYKDLALRYQDGDTITVQNNITVYPNVDESKQIIKRVAIKEKESGGIKIKVAKAASSGLAPLDQAEKDRFIVYMNRVKFVGIPIEIISQPADVLYLEATIELDSLLYKSDGTLIEDNSSPAHEALTGYLSSFPFDGSFYLSKLIDAMQQVVGVKDVHITMSKLGGAAFDRKIEEVPSGHLELDNHSTFTYVLT